MIAIARRLFKLEAGSGEMPMVEDWLDLLEDRSPDRIAAFEARFPRHFASPTAIFLDKLPA